MKLQFLLFALALVFSSLVTGGTAKAGNPTIDLKGKWSFELDPSDAGEEGRWFARKLIDGIRLPGSLQEQGFGEEVTVDTAWTGAIVDRSWFTDERYAPYRQPGKIKVPFWLQPERHYVGAAWYQREIEFPKSWAGKRVTLELERCHWETQVWLDERKIGCGDSLSVPHRFVLEEKAHAGRHRLTIRVDNRVKINVGINAHSVSDHTQGNWNGLTGQLRLTACPAVQLADIQVYPDIENKCALVRVKTGNSTGGPVQARLSLAAASFNAGKRHAPAAQAVSLDLPAGEGEVEVKYPLGEGMQLWDEFHPALYRLTAELSAQEKIDRRQITFGIREISVDCTMLTINGRKCFMRGTLECCVFPLTGYPPADVKAWRRVIRRCKDHGLNHIRFHSWCPPKAAFRAADEEGFYFQVECGVWTTVGDRDPVDQWIYAEGDRILAEYGNHPSFVMLAHGNEPGGKLQEGYLGELVKYWRSKDARRLYTGGAGWPVIKENDYLCIYGPRIQHWGAGLNSRINAKPPETRSDYSDQVSWYDVPQISHETGQWCVYPDFREIGKYRGWLKARNFEIFRDSLQANNLGHRARDFFMASGKLQVICYKEEIESALRTAGLAGYQLLSLNDFPGQGTALVGILDPFWDSKDYVSPAEFQRFCDATVPLARMGKRVWNAGETFRADMEAAHFGPAPLIGVRASWRIIDGKGGTRAKGVMPAKDIEIGNTKLGAVEMALSGLPCPAKYRFVVELGGAGRKNDWDIWVYPERLDTDAPPDIPVLTEMDKAAVERVEAGGKALFAPGPKCFKADAITGFSTVFWNTAWTNGQPPHTLGIFCDPGHPALAAFPTEYHSNWQWWGLVSRAGAMVMDNFPKELEPIVSLIDTWFENRRLGLLFEAKLGEGRLMVACMDLTSELASRPAARQMRDSLLQYMSSEAFDPEVAIGPAQVKELLAPPSVYSQVFADSAEMGYGPESVFDGDPKTMWHTKWSGEASYPPHHLVVEFREPMALRGIACLPRQDMANGRIARYEVYVGKDGKRWGKPVARGSWRDGADKKLIEFKEPVTASWLKLVARDEVNGGMWTSLAELEFIPAEE